MKEFSKQVIKNIEKYQELKRQLEEIENFVFNSENEKILQERVVEISKALTAYKEKPSTCTVDYYIPFSFARSSNEGKSVDEIFSKYPCSSEEWEIEGSNIILKVEAWFRGEFDNSYTFSIPISTEDYNSYLAKLNKKAEERRKKLEEKEREALEEKEREERKLFENLQKKYGK